MAKQISSTEIKKLIKPGNFIIGTEKSVKQLKLGKIEQVLLSSNCPASVEKSINHYALLNGTAVHKLEYPNDELGVICKKPFSISVLSFPKVAK